LKGLWDSGTEFVYDGVVGGIDLVGNAATWTYSKVGEFTYDTLHTFKMINDDMYYRGIDCYDNMSSISGQKIANWAGSIGPGIINNLTTTFNVNNFIEYLTTDDEQVIKDYSKSVIGTGTTIYGGYKLYKGAQNFVNNVNISTKQIPMGIVDNLDGTPSLTSIAIPSISIVNTVALNTALIDVGVGTAAISTNGMSSSGNKNEDNNSFEDGYKIDLEVQPKNPKKVDSNFLRKHGINEHNFKKSQNLKEPISHYNIYVDKNGSLWLLKNGTSNYIPTFENINWKQ